MRIVAAAGNYLKKIIWGVSIGAVMTGSALALDGEAFVERLKTETKNSYVSLKHGNITVDGANIIVDGIEIVPPSKDGVEREDTFPIGTVTFNNVEESSDGSFTIGEVIISDIDHEIESINFSLAGFRATKIYLPPAEKRASFFGRLPYESLVIKNFAISRKGQNFLSFRDGVVDYERNNGLASKFSVAHFSLDIKELLNVSEYQIGKLNEIGYGSVFEGSLTSQALWNTESGEMTLDKMAFTLNDVGTLSFSLHLGGITQSWVQEMDKLLKKMQDGGNAAQTTQLAALGLMQQLDVRGAGLRFDDASLTNRIIDDAANENDSSPREIIALAVQSVQMMSGLMLAKPLFTSSLVQAVDAFLKDPQSIEIVSTPPGPVSFAILTATAMTEPRDLLDALFVTVKANN